jgi:hypothetical protein
MIEARFLYQGLCGLARAHRANAMAGHLGAALVAGHLLSEAHPELEAGVHAGIARDLDRIVAGEESLWFDPVDAGIGIPELFEPFPTEPPQPERIPAIADALAGNIDHNREAGHNAIFASLALRALGDHPEHATPALLDGILRLIHLFDDATPGPGYYGAARGWLDGDAVALPDDPDLPAYPDEAAMRDAVFDELIDTASLRRQGYGGLFHIVNHSQALVHLARLGHGALGRRGLAAHHHHLRLYRSLPDVADELGPLVKAHHDPRTAAHWEQRDSVQWSAWLSHRVKTLYAFLDLLPAVRSEDRRRRAEAAFLYLMA